MLLLLLLPLLLRRLLLPLELSHAAPPPGPLEAFMAGRAPELDNDTGDTAATAIARVDADADAFAFPRPPLPRPAVVEKAAPLALPVVLSLLPLS